MEPNEAIQGLDKEEVCGGNSSHSVGKASHCDDEVFTKLDAIT